MYIYPPTHIYIYMCMYHIYIGTPSLHTRQLFYIPSNTRSNTCKCMFTHEYMYIYVYFF